MNIDEEYAREKTLEAFALLGFREALPAVQIVPSFCVRLERPKDGATVRTNVCFLLAHIANKQYVRMALRSRMSETADFLTRTEVFGEPVPIQEL